MINENVPKTGNVHSQMVEAMNPYLHYYFVGSSTGKPYFSVGVGLKGHLSDKTRGALRVGGQRGIGAVHEACGMFYAFTTVQATD